MVILHIYPGESRLFHFQGLKQSLVPHSMSAVSP